MKYKRIIAFCVALLVIPYVFVLLLSSWVERMMQDHSQLSVNGLLADTKYYVARECSYGTSFVPMEEYLVGLTAANIPYEYEDEAIKAQIVLMRTLILKHCDERGQHRLSGNAYVFAREEELGIVYCTTEQMKLLWKDSFTEHYLRLEELVLATKGLYLSYEDAPAETAFFPLSAGRTRNFSEAAEGSADQTQYPYLTSVLCENDIFSNQFVQKKAYRKQELSTLFGESLEGMTEIALFTDQNLKILERDSAGYVLAMQVCSSVISGEQFRAILGLPSACFSIEIEGEGERQKIIFTTNGIGLGIGMSQYEANAKAQNLESFQRILEYFFPGTQLKKIE